MKQIIIVVVLVFLLILVIVGFVLFDNRESNIGEIKHFRFHYTRGYAYNADISYELDCEKTCKAKYKPYGVGEEDATIKTVNKEFSERLVEILNKYQVDRWDGFNGTDRNVLDGDSFSLSITKANGESISASGYMSWPKNYGAAKAEIDSLFEELK